MLIWSTVAIVAVVQDLFLTQMLSRGDKRINISLIALLLDLLPAWQFWLSSKLSSVAFSYTVDSSHKKERETGEFTAAAALELGNNITSVISAMHKL